MICNTPGDDVKKGSCRRRNVTYETYCITCEKREREKEASILLESGANKVTPTEEATEETSITFISRISCDVFSDEEVASRAINEETDITTNAPIEDIADALDSELKDTTRVR